MRVIESESEIQEAQKLLVGVFERSADKRGRLRIGFQGGAKEANGIRASSLDLWLAHERLERSYWNALGTGDLFGRPTPAIVVEVNPPYSGRNARVSGVFLRADDGGLWLGHRGRLGGGRRGIGGGFKESHPLTRTVDDGDGQSDVIVIGEVEDPGFLEKVTEFLESVIAFKAAATQVPSQSRTQRNSCGYWAFVGNPTVFRVDDYVQDRELGHWTVRNSGVRPGDRALIWRTRGTDGRRGVVALAEVVGPPAEVPATEESEYDLTGEVTPAARRVPVRLYRPARLPLWVDDDDGGVLRELSVARAKGGTVFKIAPDQWDRILKLLGGWPGTGSTHREADSLSEFASRASPIVLVENERTAGGDYDHWQDATGERYQFPNTYKNKIRPGRRFIYYRGARRADGSRAVPDYFGHGIIGEVYLDPTTEPSAPKREWKWCCNIEIYEPFANPVPFRQDGETIEKIAQNQWSVGVREITEPQYERILELARVPTLTLPEPTDADTAAPTTATTPGSLLVTVKKTGGKTGLSGGSPRRSRDSKAVGDRGERAVLSLLREQLPADVADTLRWVAQLGERPGYDISYKSGGQIVGVEVKATRGGAFPSIEITSNEWQAASELGPRYRVALVTMAMSRKPMIDFIDNIAKQVADGILRIETSVHRISRQSVDDRGKEQIG